MKTTNHPIQVLMLALLLCGSYAAADTSLDQRLKLRFSGAGKIINVFAGKAAKDGLDIRTAVSGERRATKTGRNIEVIDIGEKKIWRYALSRKGKPKKCKVTTFDEFREQLAALEDLPFFGAGGSQGEGGEEGTPASEYVVTLGFKDTGEQEIHAGMTGDVFQFKAVAHRRGLSIDQGGGVLETTFVVGPKTDSWSEMQDWNRKWAAVIGEMTGMGGQLNKILAASPALQEVMAELRSQESKLDGTILRTHTRLSTVPDSSGSQEVPDESDETPTSLEGLGIKLGGALLRRKQEESASDAGPQELYMNELVMTALSETSDPILNLPQKCARSMVASE